MTTLDDLLRRLEELVEGVEGMPDPQRSEVLELLDGVDTLHRLALERLGELLGPARVRALRDADPYVAWLLAAYDVDPEPASVPVAAPRLRRRDA